MSRLLVLQTAALITGFLIDFFVGDPYRIPHPVVGIGKWISFFDRHLRHGEKNPKDLWFGGITAFFVCLISTAVPCGVLYLAWQFPGEGLLYYVIESIMCFQLLAARQLVKESEKVMNRLEQSDVEGARSAVSMIVGRDTDVLDEQGICRAAVETVAENASDGVIAPLFWIFLLGAPGGFFYKAVNTMDSMIGYKNDTYLYFGRAAAKLDDLLNFIPSRLSAVLMILCCPQCGLDQCNAVRIFKRDRLKHDSPNSAQTESVCAGALRIRLAGDAVYGGIVHKKEYIGDYLRDIEYQDIKKAGMLMYAASFLMLGLCVILRILVILW